MKEDDKTIAEPEQQEEQSVHDTQLLNVSPPHDTSVTTKTISVMDAPNKSSYNINPLTTEDLKNILDQSSFSQYRRIAKGSN